MKRLSYLLIFLSLSILSGCEKDNLANKDFQFEATVLNKGLDCGETFLIELKNTCGNPNIANGIYYADKLDFEFKEPGLQIVLNCREPLKDELVACTTLGSSYPHIVVIDCKKALQ